MSYVRRGEDGSDVYVYMTTAGLICCGGRPMTSTAAMVGHLRRHIAAGECVPPDVIPALEADDESNFPPGGELTARPQLFAIDVKGKPNA
jgi:hypothetical protein